MGDPVAYFEILGLDGPKLREFYTSAFGWKTEPTMAAYWHVRTSPDRPVEGGVGSHAGIEAGHVTVYVEVEDLDESLARIESLGGRIEQRPIDVPGGARIALFLDPEGHLIGLQQARPS